MASNYAFPLDADDVKYVERRAEGYYLVNSPIPLGCIVREYWKGVSAEQIRERYSTLTIEQVFGGLAFYIANASEVKHYMNKYETLEEAFSKTHPVKSPYFYLRFVTKREVWGTVKFASVIGLVLTLIGFVTLVGIGIVSLVTGVILGEGFLPAITSEFNSIPLWVWFTLLLNWFVWAAKGQTFTMPNCTKKELLIINVTTLVVYIAAKSIPSWTVILFYAAILMSMFGVYSLNEEGKRRYHKIMTRKEKRWLASKRRSEAASPPVGLFNSENQVGGEFAT